MTNSYRNSMDEGYVYFIRANDAIKIGFSKEPKRRVGALQTSHHHTLEIMATVPTAIIHEHEAHALFQHIKIRGEWFRAEPELLKFIARIKRRKTRPETFIEAPKKKADKSPEINALIELRGRHGALSPVGHRCSNIMEMLDAGTARPADIARQVSELAELTN